MPLLEVQHLQKVYTSRFGGSQVEALQNVNFSVEPGEYVAIMGESGSVSYTFVRLLHHAALPAQIQPHQRPLTGP